jgi:ABC-2 type transport system ATP-binding protein
VRVDGLEVGDKRLRSRIGYVTQSPSIYNDLTVEQNIDYFARLLGTDGRDVARVIHEVDLVKQKDQLALSLSGGQKARVSLAIALLGDPDILVLDEPTVGLDPVLRQKLWGLFRQLAKQGRSLLVSSHVMDEADRCDDVLLMRDGQLLWAGTRKELLKKAHARSVESAFLSLVEGK